MVSTWITDCLLMYSNLRVVIFVGAAWVVDLGEPLVC